MNTPARRQFLEINHAFRLVTEANKEAFAGEYLELTRRQSQAQEPVTPILGFCMRQAGTSERAEAIFNHVLDHSSLTYWPCPALAGQFRRAHSGLKAECSRQGIIPVKFTDHLAILCGTNPYDLEAIKAVFAHLPDQNRFPVFVLSEPDRILKGLEQFE